MAVAKQTRTVWVAQDVAGDYGAAAQTFVTSVQGVCYFGTVQAEECWLFLLDGSALTQARPFLRLTIVCGGTDDTNTVQPAVTALDTALGGGAHINVLTIVHNSSADI
jgi:hypothetical protein